MDHTPLLYRKRLIPPECILLKDDELIYRDAHCLITKWHTLHPKKELDHGCSCYLVDRGWKVSRFLDKQGNLLCWYCDIIDTEYDSSANAYTFVDLLADVLIYPDSGIRVVDLDEIADALEQGLLNAAQVLSCMRRLDALLRLIYSGRLWKLPELRQMQALIGDYEIE